MSDTPLNIIIVSNRGPFSFSYQDGALKVQRGSGGLVTAISAVARQYDILWISCALTKGDREWLAKTGDGIQRVRDMKLRLVVPDPAAYRAYYGVISNPLLWFIQHQIYDTPRSPVLNDRVWNAWTNGYAAINKRLAEVTADSIAQLKGQVIVMPQDYHLYLVPHYLRELVGDKVLIQPFLHIPWPGPDAWRVLPLPLRRELLQAMLQADRLGFQTERDTRRFLETCVDTLPDAHITRPARKLSYRDREIEVQPYPISVDTGYLQNRMKSAEVQKYVSHFNEVYEDRKLLLRIDRVEPSKNILRGFEAFRNFLVAYPEYQKQVDMLALLVPSRIEVPEYEQYLREIMRLVGEINATLGDGDWEPVRVLLGNNYDRAIAALSLYDVLLVNPLADGMNLVVKEGAVLNGRNGVIILSEEAGAAEELDDAPLLVSPYDVYGTREAIHTALSMPQDERGRRARWLAEHVQQNDIHRWFDRQVKDAASMLSRVP